MARQPTGFYAFPAEPLTLAETILGACTEVTRSNRTKLRPWRRLNVTGKVLINEILDAIDKSDIFVCDLTGLNLNVVFELGYAVATKKRIWVSLDTSIEQARDSFRHFSATLLPMVGYSSYENSHDLAKKFLDSTPWLELTATPLGADFSFLSNKPPSPSIFYLKHRYESNASLALYNALSDSLFKSSLFIDDPRDNDIQGLVWYAEKIRDTDAALIHLLSDKREGHESHNITASFVAGLARGLERPLLMLVEAPYNAPVDYRHLLYAYRSAEDCRQATERWLSELNEHIPRRRTRMSATVIKTLDLRSIRVGEPVAEHEQPSLDSYFVETRWFRDALDSQYKILVGRRGTGKRQRFLAFRMNCPGTATIMCALLSPSDTKLTV